MNTYTIHHTRLTTTEDSEIWKAALGVQDLVIRSDEPAAYGETEKAAIVALLNHLSTSKTS